MRNFKKYMEERLARMATNMPKVIDGPGNFYLTKYIASEKALVFRLSNDVVQVMHTMDKHDLILISLDSSTFSTMPNSFSLNSVPKSFIYQHHDNWICIALKMLPCPRMKSLETCWIMHDKC